MTPSAARVLALGTCSARCSSAGLIHDRAGGTIGAHRLAGRPDVLTAGTSSTRGGRRRGVGYVALRTVAASTLSYTALILAGGTTAACRMPCGGRDFASTTVAAHGLAGRADVLSLCARGARRGGARLIGNVAFGTVAAVASPRSALVLASRTRGARLLIRRQCVALCTGGAHRQTGAAAELAARASCAHRQASAARVLALGTCSTRSGARCSVHN